MTPDPGFAPIFKGWNVWDVFAKNDLDFELSGVGASPERRLRIFVENSIVDGAPAAAVDDQDNPLKLVGSMIQVIKSPGGLQVATRKEDVPGPALVLDGPATKHTVRFWNRGEDTELSWPQSSNFLLDAVYQPSTTSPITSGPAPSSLPGTLDQVGDSAKKTATVVLTVAGVAVGLGVVIWLASKSSRRAAA